MTWPPIIFDVALTILVWAAVLMALRQRRALLATLRMDPDTFDFEVGVPVAAGGHTPAPDLWECYVAGPESGPDPAAWRTELNRPLLR